MTLLSVPLPLGIAVVGTALIFAVQFVLQVFPGQDRKSRTR
jgi:hypothetical protein